MPDANHSSFVIRATGTAVATGKSRLGMEIETGTTRA